MMPRHFIMATKMLRGPWTLKDYYSSLPTTAFTDELISYYDMLVLALFLIFASRLLLFFFFIVHLLFCSYLLLLLFIQLTSSNTPRSFFLLPTSYLNAWHTDRTKGGLPINAVKASRVYSEQPRKSRHPAIIGQPIDYSLSQSTNNQPIYIQ